MKNLEADSVFSIMPLEETISMCTNLVHDETDTAESLNKSKFKTLLLVATQKSHFVFNILYKVKGSVAMGLSIGPTLTNVFLSFYVKKRPGQCQVEFRPVYQGR